MKKIITASGTFGPYETVEVLEDRYRVDGPADLPFTVVGQCEISDVVDGDFPAPSNAPSDEQTATQAAVVRTIRDTKLADCDWRVIKALENNIPQDFAWAAYRQALRDISSQAGFPWIIVWPAQP